MLERTWARPTLDVHGIPGGFTGAGAKTVIPAKAMAKVSMRLVPGMTPAKAFAQYKSYVEKIAPAGVDVEVRLIHSGDPCLIPVDNPYIQAATRALHEVWGKDTVFIRSGGSIPIVGDFARHLGLAQRDDGLRLARRQPACPQREVSPQEFRTGHRVDHPVYGGDGALIEPEHGPEAARRADRRPWASFSPGGESSRMGADKALIRLAGQPLVARALGILREAGLTASIAGARSSLADFAPVIQELDPDLGPLAESAAALASTSARHAVFLPVDLPLLPASLVASCCIMRGSRAALSRLPSVDGYRANLSRSCGPGGFACARSGAQRQAREVVFPPSRPRRLNGQTIFGRCGGIAGSIRPDCSPRRFARGLLVQECEYARGLGAGGSYSDATLIA